MLYPLVALERAMTIREVVLRAMSGEITWMQAAEIIGCTPARSGRRQALLNVADPSVLMLLRLAGISGLRPPIGGGAGQVALADVVGVMGTSASRSRSSHRWAPCIGSCPAPSPDRP